MRAAFYDRQGPAHEVLQVGDLPTPEPGEVRVRVLATVSRPERAVIADGAGAYRPVIGRRLPLDRVADGHDAQDSGATAGTIVVDIA